VPFFSCRRFENQTLQRQRAGGDHIGVMKIYRAATRSIKTVRFDGSNGWAAAMTKLAVAQRDHGAPFTTRMTPDALILGIWQAIRVRRL
jgi:hypothetical protein